jgi:hypothetical protein
MNSAPVTTRVSAEEASRPLLTVTVLFTDVAHTLSALRQAASLSGSLHASLRILMPIVVPYPLDLADSPVRTKTLCRRLLTIAEGVGIPTRINMVYCRDRNEAVERCLEPHSIIVVSWRKRWLFDRTSRLTRRLTRLGHHVIAA